MKRYWQYLVDSTEKRVEVFLKTQVNDSARADRGRMDSDVVEGKPTIYVLTDALCLYFSRESNYYKNAELWNAVERGVSFVERWQRPDGSLDYPTCNFYSAPDTAFCFRRLYGAREILRKYGTTAEEKAMERRYLRLLLRCIPILVCGGFHTPNHRWAVLSALLCMEKLVEENGELALAEADFSGCNFRREAGVSLRGTEREAEAASLSGSGREADVAFLQETRREAEAVPLQGTGREAAVVSLSETRRETAAVSLPDGENTAGGSMPERDTGAESKQVLSAAELLERIRNRAEQYLAEGIDGDADGEYAERSTGNYNAVVDKCLVTAYEMTGNETYLGYVERNLDMMLYYFDGDDTVFTQNSTRQDQGKAMYPDPYFYLYTYMAAHLSSRGAGSAESCREAAQENEESVSDSVTGSTESVSEPASENMESVIGSVSGSTESVSEFASENLGPVSGSVAKNVESDGEIAAEREKFCQSSMSKRTEFSCGSALESTESVSEPASDRESSGRSSVEKIAKSSVCKIASECTASCRTAAADRFDAAAHKIIRDCAARGDVAPDCMYIFMMYDWLKDYTFRGYGFLESYRRYFPGSQVLRVKKPAYVCSVLNQKARFLFVKFGELQVGVRIGEAYCDVRYFQPQQMETWEDGCVLRAVARGWYYQPWDAAPKTSDWWAMDHSRRERIITSQLELTVTVKEWERGVEVTVKSEGLSGLPLRVELMVPAQSELETDSVRLTARAGESLILRDGYLHLYSGGRKIKIGPGYGTHSFKGHYSGEEKNEAGYSIFLNDYTPYERTFCIVEET